MNALLVPAGLAEFGSALGIGPVAFYAAFAAVVLWSLVLKGFALWHAARNHQARWFIAMLVLNTVGILEIVYLVWFRKDKKEGATPSLFNNPAPAEGPPGAAQHNS